MGGKLRRLRAGRSVNFARHVSRTLAIRVAGAGIATGGLALVGMGTVATPVLSNGIALQSSGGDNNRGDVWVDNVGNPPGPGHEQDPHLACTNINLWGSGLADSSGTYSVDGWQPSGRGFPDVAYGPTTWHYNTSLGGDQVISVINVATLVADALANGDLPVNTQGLHFKLQLSQDPFKHKTFWVNCVPPATTTTTTTTTTTPTTTTTTSSTTSSTTTTAAGSPTTTTPATTTTTPSGVGAGVLGAGTATPSTGADVEFGVGLGLLIGGGGLAAGAGKLFRGKRAGR